MNKYQTIIKHKAGLTLWSFSYKGTLLKNRAILVKDIKKLRRAVNPDGPLISLKEKQVSEIDKAFKIYQDNTRKRRRAGKFPCKTYPQAEGVGR